MTRLDNYSAPECGHRDGHAWRSPYTVVGEAKWNPGAAVWAEVCTHCGTYRVVWAQNTTDVTQVLISYRPADEASREWVCARRVARATWHYSPAPVPDDDRAVACVLVAEDGTPLAACLWAGGELDVDSDACGVFDLAIEDDITWPDQDAAIAAVWG